MILDASMARDRYFSESSSRARKKLTMSKKNPNADSSDENTGITDLSAKIDSIVSRLESEDIGIELSIELFEEGMTLTSRAQKLLQEAEQRVAILSASGQSDTTKSDET